ncbi:MAG: hypothetical protein ACE5FI_10280, partial [Anaerolineales bacterium]
MSSRLLSLPGADPFGRLGQETGDLGSVSAVVMLGGCGDSPAEQLVHGARREAMHASLAALIASQRIARVVIAAPQSELDALSPPVDGKLTLDPDALGDSFHFGRRLGAIAARYNLDRLIYLGGGSAPLLPTDELDAVIDEIETAPARHAVTNNLYSSDWIAMTEARTLQGFAERLPQDNMLGWVLQEEIGYTVRALPPEAATRVDIDTPADLLALYWHPACPVNLRAYLDVHMPAESLERWRAAGRA